MEDVALAVAASNRQCEEMRQFIHQSRSDLQVHTLSHKMALEDIHAKLELIEDPSGYLDRLKSLTAGANGEAGRNNASEIARAIDFILERLTNLEHHTDASASGRSDAEAVSQTVDAKLLVIASRLEAQQTVIDNLARGAGVPQTQRAARNVSQQPPAPGAVLSGIGMARLEEFAAAQAAAPLRGAAPPAPPAPPPLGAGAPAPVVAGSGRDELLSAIGSGAALNSVQTVDKGASPRDGLLFAIGRGTAAQGLKKVETVEKVPTVSGADAVMFAINRGTAAKGLKSVDTVDKSGIVAEDPIAATMALLLEDPEVATAMENPIVAAAYQDVVENGAMAGMKYIADPVCAPLIEKMAAKMGYADEVRPTSTFSLATHFLIHI